MSHFNAQGVLLVQLRNTHEHRRWLCNVTGGYHNNKRKSAEKSNIDNLLKIIAQSYSYLMCVNALYNHWH